MFQKHTALALAVAIAGAGAAGLAQAPVPSNLIVPAGHMAYLVTLAEGTQYYICLEGGSGWTWTFYGPQATLFDAAGTQLATHFLSPNPDENGVARATWQDSADTSAVWAGAIASSTDPAYVAPASIPWLLLRVVGSQEGPGGGSALGATTFIQRVNTAGGVAPATGCRSARDAGKKALVPYTTDDVFYRAS